MFHIGILQLTQNLDDAVRGFKAGLADLDIPAEFSYLNADGNAECLPQLAQALAKRKVDLIFACSTPAAQAAKDLPGDLPVVFTPVFDPVQAGLVDSLPRPGGKLTGMSGMVHADDKVKFILELLPAAKKLGLLYHTGDANAQIEVNNFRLAARGHWELLELPIATPAELSLLGEKLTPDLDALFLPIGKIIEENFSSIAYYADALNIPIVASHAPNVVMGALAGLVANHALLGKGCAKQAQEILINKKTAGELPIHLVETPEIIINGFAADNLGIALSSALTARATEFYI